MPAAARWRLVLTALPIDAVATLQVEVDVYKRLAPVRTEPLQGSESFFQENLTKWRELNSGPDFLAAAAALQNISQTLPQLLHHRQQIMDVLLAAIKPEAALSLPPLLALVAILARDLQAEYLPLFPQVMRRCVGATL